MRRAAFVLIGLCSCAESGPVFVEWPPIQQESTLVLAFERAVGGSVFQLDRVEVIDPSAAEAAIRLGYAASDTVRATALLYDRSAESLGLPIGRLTPSTDTEGARPLPAPDRLLEMRVSDGMAALLWSPTAQLSESIAGFRSRDIQAGDAGNGCFEAAPEIVPIASTSPAAFVRPVDDNTAVLGTDNGELWTVRPGEPPTGPTRLPGGRVITTAGNSDAGFVWLGGSKGELFRAPALGILDGRVELIGQSPRGVSFQDVAGTDPSDPQIEVFTLSSDNVIERFDGTQWTEIGTLRPLAMNQALARFGPDHVVVIDGTPDLIHFDNGVMFVDRIGPTRHRLSAIRMIPGIGLVVGTREGLLVVLRDGRWEPLLSANRQRVELIAPYGDGLFFGGESGHLGQYVPERETCAIVDSALSISRVGAQFGDQVLVSGSLRGGGTTAVIAKPSSR